MAITDAFSAQIVELVRTMPDEAILALVKNQLGAFGGDVSFGLPRRRGAQPRAAVGPRARRPAVKAGGRRRAAGGRRGRGASPERQEALSAVERIVKSSSGISASEVAKSAGIPQTRAAAVLKELKLAKRIFQGGDRRFARYAGDSRTAEQASVQARKTASGPLVKRKKGRK